MFKDKSDYKTKTSLIFLDRFSVLEGFTLINKSITMLYSRNLDMSLFIVDLLYNPLFKSNV